jgi:DNA-binding NarL/FixJ family response regulator
MEPIRVLLVDDHPAIRAGLRTLLQDAANVQIVAEAGDGRQALQAIAAHHPRVVLLDVTMPGASGLEVVERVRRDWPEVRVVILSVHAEEEMVIQALRAGAAGYLLKDAGAEELEKAIRRAAEGETYLAPNLAPHVVRYLHRTEQQTDPLAQLTPRQREVLRLIAEGHSNKVIAKKLHISPKTVETHRTQLMERLNIHDIAGLTRFAIRVGLVASDA